MPELEADDVVAPNQGQPTPQALVAKYIQAIGGEQRVNALTSFVAKGTYAQFHGLGGAGNVEINAKAPNMRSLRVSYPQRPERTDIYRIFDGTNGWWVSPLTVVPRIGLTSIELTGAELDAALSFPANILKVLTNVRVGNPDVVNERPVKVLQGTFKNSMLATLYFDEQTGLLNRYVRYGLSALGRVPTQVDYAQYKDVNGLKMPYQWTFSWLDGRDTVNITDLQVNVPVDNSKFAEPPERGK
jgi:hypothetical protein